MFNNLPNFKTPMSVDAARDMIEIVNKMSNEYFTSIYELNTKFVQDALSIWSPKNDKTNKK